MNEENESSMLLALDPGVRESGWAVFRGRAVAASGVVGLKTSQKMDPGLRIDHLLGSLEVLTAQWRFSTAVQCKPGGMNLPAPALEQLERRLDVWAEGQGISLTSYSAKEVRRAVAGNLNASNDQLGYAVMLQLGLIGQGRSTREWGAIAVGHYHLTRIT